MISKKAEGRKDEQLSPSETETHDESHELRWKVRWDILRWYTVMEDNPKLLHLSVGNVYVSFVGFSRKLLLNCAMAFWTSNHSVVYQQVALIFTLQMNHHCYGDDIDLRIWYRYFTNARPNSTLHKCQLNFFFFNVFQYKNRFSYLAQRDDIKSIFSKTHNDSISILSIQCFKNLNSMFSFCLQ